MFPLVAPAIGRTHVAIAFDDLVAARPVCLVLAPIHRLDLDRPRSRPCTPFSASASAATAVDVHQHLLAPRSHANALDFGALVVVRDTAAPVGVVDFKKPLVAADAVQLRRRRQRRKEGRQRGQDGRRREQRWWCWWWC